MKRLLAPAVTTSVALLSWGGRRCGGTVVADPSRNGLRPEGIGSGQGKSVPCCRSRPGGCRDRHEDGTPARRCPHAPITRRSASSTTSTASGCSWPAARPARRSSTTRADGAELADFQLTPGARTRSSTTSPQRRRRATSPTRGEPVLYVVPRDLSGVRARSPLPDFPLTQDNNLNGIEATRRGGTLLAVQGNAGVLWRIDAGHRARSAVDLGGTSVTNGDGLLLWAPRAARRAQPPEPDRGGGVDWGLCPGVWSARSRPYFDVRRPWRASTAAVLLPNARFSTRPRRRPSTGSRGSSSAEAVLEAGRRMPGMVDARVGAGHLFQTDAEATIRWPWSLR